MTREELRGHCERQIQQFERVEKIMPVTPNDWKRYEEHKLILELLEQEFILDKIRGEIEQEIIPRNSDQYDNEAKWQNLGLRMALKVINKYKVESEDKE